MTDTNLDSPHVVESKQVGAFRWDLILIKETEGPGPATEALSMFYVRAVRWKLTTTDPRTGIKYTVRDVVFARTENLGARLCFWGTPLERDEKARGVRPAAKDLLAKQIATAP